MWILATTLINGFSAFSLNLLTQMTPPPGSDGGLLNAIYGSAAMIVVAVLLGAPIGILAGTHLAEYGRRSAFAETVRFVNDILLSAPSIIIGLFVYVSLTLATPAAQAMSAAAHCRRPAGSGSGGDTRRDDLRPLRSLATVSRRADRGGGGVLGHVGRGVVMDTPLREYLRSRESGVRQSIALMRPARPVGLPAMGE